MIPAAPQLLKGTGATRRLNYQVCVCVCVCVKVYAHLVPEQVLLVVAGVLHHLQAEDAEQERRLSMEGGEVLHDVRVEGRAKRAHLETHLRSEPAMRERRCGGQGTHLADVGHLARLVVGLHVVEESRLAVEGPLTDPTQTWRRGRTG